METAPEANSEISVHQSLGYWTSLLSRAMEAEFNQRLSPHGLTRMSCAVLASMVFDGKSSPSGIADFMGLDRGATTRLLDKLETQGLIMRDRDKNDRRSVSTKVTPRGKAVAIEAQSYSRAVNAMFTEALTPDQADEFVDMVKAMLAHSGTRVESL